MWLSFSYNASVQSSVTVGGTGCFAGCHYDCINNPFVAY